jgi:hypothetical protein
VSALTATRKTFVVSVRDQEGPATVHEVRTGRKARLELGELAGQIERWMREERTQDNDRNGRNG